MRMLHPSLGEMFDRITILELKIGNAKTKEQSEHFTVEWQELTQRTQASLALLNEDAYLRAVKIRKDLKEVNSRLWNLEDEQRACLRVWNDRETYFKYKSPEEINDFLLRTANRSYLITSLNDQRAKLVNDASSLVAPTPLEKIHV